MKPVKLTKQVRGFGFIDGVNKWHWQVVEASSDPVMLCGVTPSGDFCFFEGPAYDLKDWCKNNGFDYYCGEATVEIKMVKQ
jgi:hypothetical protein